MNNRKSFIIILILFVFVCFKIAFANFNVEINKTSISLSEPVIIKITLDSNDGELKVEECEDFSITNRNIFVNTEIINFKATVKKTYEFTLFPNKEGELKTPRFIVSADGEDSYIEPKTITVSQNNYSTNNNNSNNNTEKNKNNIKNRQKNNTFSSIFDDEEDEDLNSIFERVEKLKKQIFGDDEDNPIINKNSRTYRNRILPNTTRGFLNIFKKPADIFVKSSLPDQNAYVNQQLIYTIDLYMPVDKDNFQIRLIPSVNKDVLIQKIEPDKIFETEYDGNLYNVHRMFVALYPMKSGYIDINPFDINCFSSQYGPKSYKTDKFKLYVDELPEPKPENFSQGVGDFDFDVSCDSEVAEISKPITLTLRVQGEGNASSVNLYPPILKGADKFNDSDSIIREEKNDKIVETKELKVVFVPTEGGELEIPDITLSFFDPISERYYTKTSYKKYIKVFGNKKQEEGFTGNSEIRALIKNNMTFRNSDGIFKNPYIISFSSLPFLAFICLLLKKKLSKISFESNNSKTTEKAYSELKKDLKKCGEKDYNKVSESLVKYLANKLKIEDKGLTTKAIIAELRKKCDNEELIGKIKDIFILCDEARFNSDIVVDSGTEVLIKSCIATIGELEKKLC